MKPLFFAFAAAMSWAVPQFAQAHEVDLKTCEAVVNQVKSIHDKDLLDDCSEFYWHHGRYDKPPGSFNNVIALSYRSLGVDPRDEALYSTLAWILWSKWAAWNRNPLDMPDGEGKAAEAVLLLHRGEYFFPKDSQYYLDAANTMWPLAKQYLSQYYPDVIGWYVKADRFTTDKRIQLRARLNLGHIHRALGKKDDAISWYKAVLAIDPENAVAKRELDRLTPVNP